MVGVRERRNPMSVLDKGERAAKLTAEHLVVDVPEPAVEMADSEYQSVGVMNFVARHRVIVATLFIILALVSLFPVREVAATPETYSAVIQTLDEKKSNVMALMAASTVASAGVSLLPDDTGTPIAEKLVDLSSNFAIVLGMIYLEKYLLTILGTAAFGMLVPAACVLLAFATILYRRSYSSFGCARIATRLILLSVVLVATIPTSVAITNQIDATFEESFAASEVTQEAESGDAEQVTDEDERGFDPIAFIQGIPDALASIPETVADGVTSVSEDICNQVNRLIEQFAVMIVTSCVIPILVLLFFLWMANVLLGIDVSAPMGALRARGKRLATPPKARRRGARGAEGPEVD